MARYQPIIFIVLLSLCVPAVSSAWVSKRAAGREIHHVIPYKPLWVTRVKKGQFFQYKRMELSSPVADDGVVYVGSDSGYFQAYTENKGKKIWRYETEGSVNSGAAVGLGNVYFGDDDGYFYALNKETGTLVWQQQYGYTVTAQPLLIGERLYLVTDLGAVLAVDALSGAPIWTNPHQMPAFDMTVLGQGTPAYTDEDGGRLYVGFSDGSLQALSAKDGRVIWTKQLSAAGKRRFVDVDMQPWLEGDHLYAATFSGHLYCLKRSNAEVVWRVNIGSAVRFSVEGDELYVAGSDGALYSLRKHDGSQRWKYQTQKGGLTRPLVYHNLVIVGSTEHSMMFFDNATGKHIITRFARKNVYSDPILAGPEGNILIYFSNGGRLYALQLRDRKLH